MRKRRRTTAEERTVAEIHLDCMFSGVDEEGSTLLVAESCVQYSSTKEVDG